MASSAETSLTGTSCRFPAGVAKTQTFTTADAQSAAWATLVQDVAARRAALEQRLFDKERRLEMEALSRGLGSDPEIGPDFNLDEETVHRTLSSLSEDQKVHNQEVAEHGKPVVHVMNSYGSDEVNEHGEPKAIYYE